MNGCGQTSVPGSVPAGLRVFICSRMNPMVCCLITAMCDCNWWILALASASLASSSEFSADRASLACTKGLMLACWVLQKQLLDTHLLFQP